MLAVTALLFFGIKDIKTREKKVGINESFCRKVRTITIRLLESVRSEKVLIIAFMGNLVNKVGNMASYTFGTLLIKDSFPDTKDGQHEADNLISIVITVSNILVIPIALLYGYAMDRTKSWYV